MKLSFMIKENIKEIRAFCESNSDPKIIATYSKYFKEGFDGFGYAKGQKIRGKGS